MNKAIFITVRTGSTRLPKKALIKINHKTTIEHLIDRVKKAHGADTIVLCTTELPEDDVLCEIATQNKISFFRGSVEDKLSRWNNACKMFDVEFFVTADGDDLFCEPELIDLAFKQYKESSADFIQSKGIVCGAFTYGIKATALQKVCEIKDSNNTEMMWVYFTQTNLFDVQELENVPALYKRNDIRMTLDYEDDLRFFQKVIDDLGDGCTLREIVEHINKYPEIREINYYLQDQWAANQLSKVNLSLKENVI